MFIRAIYYSQILKLWQILIIAIIAPISERVLKTEFIFLSLSGV